MTDPYVFALALNAAAWSFFAYVLHDVTRPPEAKRDGLNPPARTPKPPIGAIGQNPQPVPCLSYRRALWCYRMN